MPDREEKKLEPFAVSVSATAACCGPSQVHEPKIGPREEQSFVTGSVESATGPVPRVDATLTGADRRGAAMARWGVGRMDYAVAPGLYAVGAPDPTSPVLLSANYKMSFDHLRRELVGRDAWILVLDTKGINVWCAAGKGTFGTGEAILRIREARLHDLVEHRKVIAPQLGAPGLAAHDVREQTGFKVRYGPVEAADLPTFLDGGKVTDGMRHKRFPLRERLALVPLELIPALKVAPFIAAAFLFLAGLGGPGGYWDNVLASGLLAVLVMGAAVFAGAVLTPTLLPWLPGRAFSTKGFVTGLALAAAVLAARGLDLASWPGRLEALSWLLIAPMFSAYLGMNFTGASTYTSLSGVRREMRRWVPLQIGGAAIGLALWIASRFTA